MVTQSRAPVVLLAGPISHNSIQLLIKKRKYNDQVMETELEGTLTPLVYSIISRMAAPECKRHIKIEQRKLLTNAVNFTKNTIMLDEG